MARHGSGQDLGRFGEWAYRLFVRLPEWLGLAVPIVLFVLVLEVGEAFLLSLHEQAVWLRSETTYRSFAFWVVPIAAFLIALIVFEMALITYFLKTGRWKLLHLQSSMRDIRSLQPRDFERLVGAAYEQQGYRVEYAGKGQDGGIDLVMHRGSEKVLVQCKNWSRAWTGAPEVRELYGVLTAQRARKSIFVTSGVFSEEAIAFAKGKPIQLIDGQALLDMIEAVQGSVGPLAAPLENGSGSPDTDLNQDKLCPICHSPTVRKVAHRGEHAGNAFWSCSRFPKCYGIAPE